MEPVGVALGTIGLLGLFSTCLDALEKLDSYLAGMSFASKVEGSVNAYYDRVGIQL